MTERPLILGHRGASAVAPENTLAAFSRAIDDGADGIEFDVRLSRDGVPIVIHDETLKRTGLIDRLVSELTAKELREIDVGSWFASQSSGRAAYTGEKLPSLSQVFQLFNNLHHSLYVEMKCDPGEADALAAAVAQAIREFRIANQAVVESFDLDAIGRIKIIDSSIRTAALFEPKLSQPLFTVRRRKMIDRALAMGADELALHHTLAGPYLIDRAKQAGLEIVLWTVDEPRWITRARKLGVKALIANDPARMIQARIAQTLEHIHTEGRA